MLPYRSSSSSAEVDKGTIAFTGCPHVAWLNLSDEVVRRENMSRQLVEYGLYHSSTRFQGWHGDTDRAYLEQSVCEIDRDWIAKRNIYWKEVAVTVGHLSMIRTWLFSITGGSKTNKGEGDACLIGMEDDVSFEYVDKWQAQLQDAIAALPAGWHTAQLSCQGPADGKLAAANQGRKTLWVPWELHHYGAYAYIVSLDGAQRLIDRHWNQETGKWTLLNEGNAYNSFTADTMLFQGGHGYSSCIPWFVFGRGDSTIHQHHVGDHHSHLDRVRQLYESPGKIVWPTTTPTTDTNNHKQGDSPLGLWAAPIYWLNLDSCCKRRRQMESQLNSLGVPQHLSIRTSALDGRCSEGIERIISLLGADNRDTIANGGAALHEQIDWKAAACTLGHLQTIHRAYTAGHEWVLVLEDDASFEFSAKWQRQLSDFISNGGIPDENWHLVQLGSNGPRMANVLAANRDHYQLCIPWQYGHYGSFAYAIHRRGMEHVVCTLYNSKTETWNLPLRNEYNGRQLPAADVLVMDQPHSWTSTIPWIMYEGADSIIHPDHLLKHQEALDKTRELYAGGGAEAINW